MHYLHRILSLNPHFFQLFPTKKASSLLGPGEIRSMGEGEDLYVLSSFKVRTLCPEPGSLPRFSAKEWSRALISS